MGHNYDYTNLYLYIVYAGPALILEGWLTICCLASWVMTYKGLLGILQWIMGGYCYVIHSSIAVPIQLQL